MIEPSIVKEKFSEIDRLFEEELCGIDEAAEVEYAKKCDTHLRRYVLTDDCRWDYLDKYFGNPPHGRPSISLPSS